MSLCSGAAIHNQQTSKRSSETSFFSSEPPSILPEKSTQWLELTHSARFGSTRVSCWQQSFWGQGSGYCVLHGKRSHGDRHLVVSQVGEGRILRWHDGIRKLHGINAEGEPISTLGYIDCLVGFSYGFFITIQSSKVPKKQPGVIKKS